MRRSRIANTGSFSPFGALGVGGDRLALFEIVDFEPRDLRAGPK